MKLLWLFLVTLVVNTIALFLAFIGCLALWPENRWMAGLCFVSAVLALANYRNVWRMLGI